MRNRFVFYPVNVLNMQSPSKVFSKLFFDMTGELRTNPQSALEGIQKYLKEERRKKVIFSFFFSFYFFLYLKTYTQTQTQTHKHTNTQEYHFINCFTG